MKKALLTILRDTQSSQSQFRKAAAEISLLLAADVGKCLKWESFRIKTPLAETEGERLSSELVIIPILRSGLAMLDPFLELFPEAKVGFFGMRRDEVTKKPHLYYENLPPIKKNQEVILIDPMLATGGSGELAIKRLLDLGVDESSLVYVSIIAAPEGVAKIQQTAPKMRIVIAQIDDCLNDQAFIVPGIGDFGDRFFGT